MTPAHSRALMAPVPLSVRRSMRTSSGRILKGLKPAARITRSRSSGVVSRIGSTTLIRKGSMMVFKAGSSESGRCTYYSAALAEADAGEALALAEGPEDHLVAVLEEPALLARGQPERAQAPPGDLEERAQRALLRTRDRAAGEEVPG